MKIQATYCCNVCNNPSPGTLLHMFWKCPVISEFWVYVNSSLSDGLEVFYIPNLGLCLLNDTTDIPLKQIQCKMFVGGGNN